MNLKKSTLIKLLVALGLYSISNAEIYANSISANDSGKLVKALSSKNLHGPVFSAAATSTSTGNGK